MQANGVPPNIDNNIHCTRMLDICKDTLKELTGLIVGMKDAVANILKKRRWQMSR